MLEDKKQQGPSTGPSRKTDPAKLEVRLRDQVPVPRIPEWDVVSDDGINDQRVEV